MTNFLDVRTSQNASIPTALGALSVAPAFDLIGQIGLIVVGAGSNVRVDLWGTMGVDNTNLLLNSVVTLRIVRGTLDTDPVVYEAAEQINFITEAGSKLLTIQAADFNPTVPVSGQLTYTLFANSSVIGVNRVGPESFGGVAVSD
jgi:hypothetical protein